MRVFEIADSFQAEMRQRKSQDPIAFVPTMGNLHAGHLSLVDLAKKNAQTVVVSLFVNPTQFAPHEDFNLYPRTPEEDLKLLEKKGVDVVFMPSTHEMYGPNFQTQVVLGKIAENYEGKIRPGHFTGVCTVVVKLCQLCHCDILILGEKDFQQLQVLRRCLIDLNFDLKIIEAPTLRESHGLAMSSRNQYLSPFERQKAGLLYQVLCQTREWFWQEMKKEEFLGKARSQLLEEFQEVQYFDVIEESTFLPQDPVTFQGRIIAAVRMKTVRLIDNLPLRR